MWVNRIVLSQICIINLPERRANTRNPFFLLFSHSLARELKAENIYLEIFLLFSSFIRFLLHQF